MSDTTQGASTVWSIIQQNLGQDAAEITGKLTAAGVPQAVAEGVAQVVATGSGSGQITVDTSTTIATAFGAFASGSIVIPDGMGEATISDATFSIGTDGFTLSANCTVTPVSSQPQLTLDGTLSLVADCSQSPGKLTASASASRSWASFGTLDGNCTVGSSLPATEAATFGAFDLTWTPGNTTAQVSDLFTLIGLDNLATQATKFNLDKLSVTSVTWTLDLSAQENDLSICFVSNEWDAVLEEKGNAFAISFAVMDTSFKDLAVFPDVDLEIGTTLLAFATAEIEDYSVPDAIADNWTSPATVPDKLSEGIGLWTSVNLADSGNDPILQALTGSDQLGGGAFSAELDLNAALTLADDDALSASASIAVGNGVKIGNFTLKDDVAIAIDWDGEDDQISFTIDAEIDLSDSLYRNERPTGAKDLVFKGLLRLGEESIAGDLSLTLEKAVKLPGVNVFIDGLGAEFGFDYDVEEAVVGVAAMFELGTDSKNAPTGDASQLQKALRGTVTQTSGADHQRQMPEPDGNQIAIILGLDLVDEVPDLDLFLLSIPTTSEPLALSTALLDLFPDFPNDDFVKLLKGMTIGDILLFWCDQIPGTLLMPDTGRPVEQSGFMFRGGFNFFGKFAAFAYLSVSTDAFSAVVLAEPFSIGDILKFTQDSQFRRDALTAQLEKDAATAGFTDLGPYFYFDSTAQAPTPYISTRWNAELFGGALDSAGELSISGDTWSGDFVLQNSAVFGEFAFDFETDLSTFSLSVTVQLDHSIAFDIIGRNVQIDLDTGFDLSMSYETGVLTIQGDFSFQSAQLTLPETVIDAATIKNLETDLPEAIAKAIEKQAQVVFEDAIQQAGKWIAKYTEDAANEFEKLCHDFEDEIKDLAGVIKSFLDSVVSIDGKHALDRPDFLKDGTVISCDQNAADYVTLSDPDDPRAHPDAIFVVHDQRLRYVPDISTYKWMQGQGMEPQALPMTTIVSIPLDVTTIPSRQAGTLIEKVHVEWDDVYTPKKIELKQFFVVVVQALDNSDEVGPYLYPVDDQSEFNAVLRKSDYPVMLCADDDVDAFGKSDLSKPCLVFNCSISINPDGSKPADNAKVYVLLNGALWYVPNTTTLGFLKSPIQDLASARGLDQATFDAIDPQPQRDLADMGHAKVVQSTPKFLDGTPASDFYNGTNAKLYYVDQDHHVIRHFPDWNSFKNGGYVTDDIETVDAEVMELFSTGKDMTSKGKVPDS